MPGVSVTYITHAFVLVDVEQQRSDGKKVSILTLATFVQVMACKFTSHQIYWLLLQISEMGYESCDMPHQVVRH